MLNNACIIYHISKFTETLNGYNKDKPDPQLVIDKHPNLRLEYRNNLSALGNLLKEVNGNYSIVVPEISESNLTVLSRRRFTMAHELGHYWEITHHREILRLLNRVSLSYAEREQLCNLFAIFFLAPFELLKQKCCELERRFIEEVQATQNKTNLPLFVFLNMAKELPLNATALLRQLVRTGVCLEKNWLLALFQYCRNPMKAGGVRWRLCPGCIMLPKGISRSKKIEYKNITMYTEPGFRYTGIDSMGLGLSKWNSTSSVQWIYDNLQYQINKHADINENPIFPWFDLNIPPSLTMPDSRADVSSNKLSLQYKKLWELEKLTGCLPISKNLFCGTKISSISKNDPLKWKNVNWRLSAHNLRVIGWKRPHNEAYLLVSAQLSLNQRTE
jgi:uncharacterized protein DUF955